VTGFLLLLLFAGSWLAYRWLRNRLESLKTTRKEARRIRALGRARTRRPLLQLALAALPSRWVQRLFRWAPPSKPSPLVAIARTGPLGRPVRISPAQHILCVGETGSGKSSALRVLAAYALMHPHWLVTVLDGKWGRSSLAYRDKAEIVTTLEGITARLADLVERELPARAMMFDPPHRAVIFDETRLLRQLPESALRNLVVLVESARELNVHVWCGFQDVKTTVLPSELREQLTCKIAFRVETIEASQITFKDAQGSGWNPHLLTAPGQCYVKEGRRRPRPVYGLWLPEHVLAALRPRVCLAKDVPSRALRVAPVARTPVSRDDTCATATGNVRADAFAEALEQALLDGPQGVRALARATGHNPGTVTRKLDKLTARGTVVRTTEGGYALATAPAEED